MKARRHVSVLGVLSAASLCWQCTGDATSPALTVERVEVTPAHLQVSSLGDTVRLVAAARNAAGGVIANKTFGWTSSDESVVTVNSMGLVTAVANGSATVTATTDAVSGSASVTVSQLVANVEVTPSAATLTALGDTVPLSAAVLDSLGNDVAGVSVAWASSDTGVVTVDGVGRAVAVDNGSATVTALAHDVAGTVSITVAQAVAEVLVTPGTATLSPGDTVRLSAAAKDARGNPILDRSVTWETADPAVATVGAAGLVDAVGLKLGPVAVSAVVDGETGTAQMDVVTSFVSVGAGEDFTCALTFGGEAYCWGRNDDGELGDGSTVSSTRPVLVAGGRTFASLSVGTGQACGVTLAGPTYCWGAGGLGDGTWDGSSIPVAVAGDVSFVSVSVGAGHTCGVAASGAAYCWGANTNGALGDGTGISRPAPVPVAGGLAFESISAGSQITCGIGQGAAYCWGYLRRYGAMYAQLEPLAVAEGRTWSLLTTFTETCGVTHDATTYCWFPLDSLEQVPGAQLPFASIAAGFMHICGLQADGVAYCWGWNGDGQLGDGTTIDRTEPVGVTGNLSFAGISASKGLQSRHHTCGSTAAGAVYCWGSNTYGQLGDGTYSRRLEPTVVQGSHR